MGKIVQVNPGFVDVLLPGSGRSFQSGQSTTLTDAEYAGLAAATLRTITVTSSGVADPVRTPLGAPVSLADALSQSKAYTDSQKGVLTGTSQTTAPTAGAGAALPATPTGYLSVTINGVARKIAYY